MEHFYKDIHGWSTEHDQLSLLKMMLPKSPTHLKIAELGVWKGRQTAMWVVELLNNGHTFEYHAIDWFSSTYNIGYGTTTYEIAKNNLSKVIDKINLIKSPTSPASMLFPDEHFDIVYVDAGHEYHAVKSDIKNWLPKVKKGGWICGDDYIGGWPGVIKAVDGYFDKIIKIGSQQWAYKIDDSFSQIAYFN